MNAKISVLEKSTINANKFTFTQVKILGTLLDLGNVLSDCIMGSYSIRSLDLWTQKESEFKLPKNWNYTKAKELFLFTIRKIKTDIIEDVKRKSKTVSVFPYFSRV